MMKPVFSTTEAQNNTSNYPWGTLTWLASSDLDNTNHTAMAYVVIAKDQKNPRHRHVTCEELLHLLKGKLVHSIGDETYELTAGDTITIPAGAYHNAINTGDEDAHMVVVYSSAQRDFELEPGEPDEVGE